MRPLFSKPLPSLAPSSFALLSWAGLALLAGAHGAAAITVCYPRDEMLSYISRDYQATTQGTGIMRPSSVMELWVSERDGDWLIVTTDINGSSCIVAYGEDFTPVGSNEES